MRVTYVKMVRPAWTRELMPSQKLLLGIFSAFVLVTNIEAGPSRGKGIFKCVSFCKESSKFNFEEYTTNIYDYNTQINTSIIGGTLQQSNLYLSAKVEISSTSPCELQLQVTNVRIEESQADHLRAPVQGADQLIQQLQKNPLRYSFQDGKIEHICPTDEDPIWVLNVKRGILSTLQNTMGSFSQEQSIYDVDVSGRCLTKYQPSSNSQSGTHYLQRQKDLKGCSQHHSHLSVFQSIPYTSNSPQQTIPLLTGTQVCSQTVVGNKISHVECREVHTFQPFQNGGGAQTTVTQRLMFVSAKSDSVVKYGTPRMRKASLVLETQSESEALDGDITAVLSLLEKLDVESFPKVQLQTPEDFIDLVQQLRSIKYDALKALLARAPGKTGRRHILDALPLVGTAPSMTLMRELFQENKLSQDQADVWLGSLNFIKNPNIDMISAIRPLLDGEPRNQVLLSVSSLVYSYCKEHEDCTGENSVIEDVLQQLISFIGTNCKLTDANRDDLTGIVVALKAIGNAGRLPSNDDQKSFNTLKRCFDAKSNNPTEVRLAAVDAFRRIPCRLYKREDITALFTNVKENTEVRIHAYLTAMKCPDRQFVKTIEGVLYSEAVNQVGSFVWTHLTNLQETASPDKQALKDLVSNNFLQNKFSTDARKFSRNYEGTMYWEKENIGVGMDSNLIFVPDSFVPRSAMVNLTCHLFGESVNLVEFGARVHSLEQLLEPLFGPTGYFPDQTVNEALHTMRVKRDAFSSDVRRLDTVYSQAAYGAERLPGGSIYTRVFGNELAYKTFELSHNTPAPTLVDETGKNWLDITHLFDNLRTGKSTEFTKSSILMDASYTVSTSAGIPLSLTVQSAATVAMSASGRVDLSNFWDKNELEIEGSLRPSAAVEVHGTLSVQLGKCDSKITSGLKLQTTMHSSTASQAKIMMKGSKIVHLSMTLPEDKQEIFETQSKLLIVHPSGTTEIIDPAQNEEQQKFCTPDVLSKALGIRFCGETNIPEKLSFPLFTPTSVSIYVEKTDTFKSYELDYKWEDDEGKADIGLVFSTPGSKIDRRLAADFHYDKTAGTLETILECPGIYFRADGKSTLTQQGLEILLTSAQKQVLHVNAALQYSGTRIEPNLLVAFYGKSIVEVEGEVDLLNLAQQGGKANLELTLKHLTESPIRLTGDMVHNGDAYDSNLAVQSYLLSGNAVSQFRIKPNLLSTKAEIKHSWKQAPSKTINLSAKIQKTKTGSLAKYTAGASYTAADSPDSHAEIELETKTSTGYCENTVKYILGKSRWEGKVLYNRQASREYQDLHFQLALVSPRNGLDYNLEFAHQLNTSGMSTKFIARTDTRNELNAQLQYRTETEGLQRKSFISEISWPSHKYSLRALSNEIRPGQFESEITIIPNRGEEMKGTMLYKNVANNFAFEQSIEFRVRGFMATTLSGSASISASEKLRHIGGQVQIEGSKDYSGRWSTSLDYSLIKKNTRKIEAKLSLNENKYNAELNWRQAKNGDRVGFLDLQLARRIRFEAQVKGTLPQKVTGTLTYYPDRDANPTSKLLLKGTVDTKSIGVSFDYFGQVAILTGSFANNRAHLGAEWAKNMLFNLTINSPHLESQNIDFTLKLETPLDGFNEIGIRIRHRITENNQIDTEIQTQIEEKVVALAVRGILSSLEYRGTVIVDISKLQRFEGNVKLLHNRDITSLDVTGELGNKLTFFKIENRRLFRGFNLNLDFSGCGGVPQVMIDLKHQKLEVTTTTLLGQWTPTDSTRAQQLNLNVVSTSPWNHNFSFSSPFSKIEKFDGRIDWKATQNSKALDLNLNWPFIGPTPVSMSASIYSENSDFKHKLTFTWPSGTTSKTIAVQTDGRISADLNNLVLNATLRIPDHVYEIELQRNKDSKHYTSHIVVLYDKNRASLATNWHFENTQKSLKLNSYVTAEWPSQPKLDLHFHYDHGEQKTSLRTYAMQGQSTLVKINGEFEYDNWQYWDITGIVESQLNWFPVGSFVSKNRLLEFSQIHHVTQASITPKFFKFSGDETKKVSFKFDVLEGRDILSTFLFNNQEIRLTGKLSDVENTMKIQLELTSPLFDPMRTNAEMKTEEQGVSLSFNAFVKDVSVINLKTGGKQQGDKISGNLDFTWPLFGHRFEADAEIDLQENLFKINFKEDEKYLIKTTLSAQMLPNRGHILVDIEGKVIPSNKFKIDTTYRVESGKLQLNGKYVNQEMEASITGLGIFNDDVRKFSLSVDGSKKIVAEIELSDWNKLGGFLSVENVKMFGFDIVHHLEKGDYAMGKHVLTINVDTGKSYTIISSLALDLDKIILTINTPFDGWKEFGLSTTFKFEPTDKKISITAHRQSEMYVAHITSESGVKSGTYFVKIETPIDGFKTGEMQLKYSLEQNAQNTLTLSLEGRSISLSANWTNSKMELLINTPFDSLKKLAMSGEWTDSPNHHIHLVFAYNDLMYGTEGNLKLLPGILEANLVLSGAQKYNFEVSYDINSDFKGKAVVSVAGKKHEIGGFVNFEDQGIHAGIHTPVRGLENVSLKVDYSQSDMGEHVVKLEWNLNGDVNQAEFNVLVQAGKVKLAGKTPFHPWDEVIMSLDYAVNRNRRLMDFKLERGDGKHFAVSSEIQRSGGNFTEFLKPMSALIRLEIMSNLTGLETFKLNGKYNRQMQNHEISASCNLFGETIEGKAKLQIEKTNGLHIDVDAEAAAPGFGVRQTSLSAFLHADITRESTLKAEINFNGKQQTLEGTFKLTDSQIQLYGQSSFQALSILRLSGHYRSDGRVDGVIQINEKRTEAKGQILWGGLAHTKVIFEVTSPFEGFKSTHLEADSNFASRRGTASFLFQNDHVRYIAKMDGAISSSAGHLTVQINSPIHKLEQVMTLLQYNVSGIRVKFDRNTKEEINGQLQLIDDQVHANFISKIPGYEVEHKSAFNWGKGSVGGKMNFEAGLFGQRITVKTIIEGIHSVNVDVGTTVRNYEHFNFQWKLEGNLQGGKVRASYDIPKLGSKSVRSSWKNDDKNNVKAELWINSTNYRNEKGFNVQYSFVPGKTGSGKFGGSLVYVLDKKEQELTLTTSLKRTGKKHTLELVFRTPFKPIQEVAISGTLLLNPEIAMDMVLTHNQIKLLSSSANILVSPPTSKLKLSFNAPMISDPFNFNAAYDLTTSDKTLEISFQQNEYQITVKTLAAVPQNSQEIELRMTVESNVPSVTVSASGSLKAGLKVEHDGNRQVSLSIDSEQTGNWKITASIQTSDNFNMKFGLESPVPDTIPSAQAEVKCIGDFKEGLSSEFVLRVNSDEIKATLTSGPQKFLTTFKSNIVGVEDFSLEGKLDTTNGYKAKVEISVANERFSLAGNISLPSKTLSGSGSIVLNSSWQKIPSGSLDIRMSENGDLEMKGTWGERSVGIRGHLKRGSHSSLLKSGGIDLTFILDSQEQFQVISTHYFDKPQYSLNISSGDYKMDSYIHTGSKLNILSTIVQWAEGKVVKFYGETRLGHFNATVSSPWTSEFQATGSYVMSQELHSAKGVLIYDGIQSVLEANVATKSDSFKSGVNIDIPLLNQKMEALINIHQIDGQNIEGNIELNMIDRHLAVRGMLSTGQHKSSEVGKIEEKTLQLSILFPNSKYSDISTEVTIKKPVDGFASLKVDAKIVLPTGPSKASLHYELPIQGSNKLTTEFEVFSPYLLGEPISGSIKAEIEHVNKVNATLKHGENDVRISWDLGSRFTTDLFAYLPAIYPDSSPLTIGTEGEFDFPNTMSLHVRASYEKHSLVSETTFIQTDDGFNSKLILQAPLIFDDKQEFYFKLNRLGNTNFLAEFTGRNGKSAVLAIGELVIRDHDISLSGKISGLNGAHFIQIVGSQDGNSFLGEISAESLSLLSGKKILISGRFDLLDSGFAANVECRTRKAVHGAAIKVNLAPSQGSLSFKVNSPGMTPILFDSEYKIEPSLIYGRISTDLSAQSHSIEFKFDKRNLEGQVIVNCPTIMSHPFNIHLKCIVEEKDISLLSDLSFNGDHWRLEGTARFAKSDDIEIKLEVITPQKSMERITIGVKANRDEIRFELQVPNLPNVVFSLTGFPLFEEFNWKNMKPEVIIGLPWVSYSAALVLRLPTKSHSGEFRAMFQQSQTKKKEPTKFDISIQISSLSQFGTDMDAPALIKFHASTPYPKFRTLEWELGGHMQWKNWAEIKLTGNLNDEQISLITELRNEADSPKFSAELVTPFKNYERFSFLVMVQKFEEIGYGRSIQIEFYHPGWDKPMNFEIDYNFRIDGLTNMEGELSLKAPAMEIPPLVLHLTSTLKETSYNGGIEGTWGDHHPSLKIVAGLAPGNKVTASIEITPLVDEGGFQASIELGYTNLKREKSATCELKINHEEILSFNLLLLRLPEMIDWKVDLKTPFHSIPSASAALRISPLTSRDSISFAKIIKSLDLNIEASLNSKKLLQFELVNKNGRRSLSIQNPFHPIAVSVSFDHQPTKLRMYGEVCWDLLKPEESTRGVGLTIDNVSGGGHDINLKLLAGEKGTLELIISHLLTATKLDHNMKIKWKRPSKDQDVAVGFQVILNDISIPNKEKYDVVFRVDTPWRCIEFESRIENGENNFSRLLMVKWDALQNPYKRAGVRYARENIPSWRSHSEKQSLTIIHAGLPHDLTFTLEKSYTNDEIQFTEFTLQPNSFPQDQLTVRTSHISNRGDQLIVILPSINLDINIIARRTDTSSSLHISHMDILGDKYALSIETINNPSTTLLDIQAGPENNLSPIFHLECRPDEDIHMLSFRIASLEFNGNLEKTLPLLRANLNFDYGRKISFMAGLPHKKEITLKILRNELGMNINELLMSLKLNASHIISTRVQWRPELFNDLEKLSTRVPASIKGYLANNIPKALAQVNEEIEERLRLLDPGVNRLINTMKTYIAEEAEQFSKEFTIFVDYLGTLPLNNTYFDINFAKLAQVSTQTMHDLSMKAIAVLEKSSAAILRRSVQIYTRAKALGKKYYGHLETLIMPLWDQAEGAVRTLWTETRTKMSTIIERVNYISETLTNIIEMNMEALEKQISGIELFKRIKRISQDYSTWLNKLPIQDYTGHIWDTFVQNVWHPLEHYSKPCFVAVNKVIEDGNLYALLEIPPLPYVRYVTLRMTGAVTGLWKIVEAEQKIKNLFRHILHNLDAILQRHIPTASLVWDVSKGHIEYHQPLGMIEWEDFTQTPRLTIADDDEMDGRQIIDFYFSIFDTLRSAQPFLDFNMRDILPPFGAHAIMAGENHFYTFDKKYYRFSGECGYVLVADLLHQNFTMVVNYAKQRDGEIKKKSYSLVSGNQIIEIDTTTFKVTMQGRKVDLPLEVGPTFIRRQPTGLEVFDTRGFQIRCTLSPSICVVSVSGWYFGKLGGLLGTYDNEITNDLKTPDGQIVTDVSVFAHSWRVGSNSDQCKVKSYVRDETPTVDVDGICGDLLLNQNSPFRPCFGLVDPTEFLNMCKYDTHKNLNSADRKGSSCTAIGAYVLECQKNKIDLWMPPHCVRCKLEDGSAMTSGDNITLSSDGLMKPPSSSDIVVLIEEAATLQEFNLNDIMSKLDLALEADGLTQNRYAIVRFGGKGPHRTPHIRTVAGQVWVHSTLRKFSNDPAMEGLGGGDLYDAMEFAARIGHRAGVSKVMIAIVADNENCGDSERYPDALTMLFENDFQLHILTPKDFTLKHAKKNESGKDIFGVDMDGVYTARQSKRVVIEGDKSMRQHVVVSKDFCTPLAMETNGTLFNLKHIRAYRGSAKKFMDVWSRRVAKSSHPAECQHCECMPDRNGGSVILCNQCISPHMRKFFDDWDKYELQEGDDDQVLPGDLPGDVFEDN